MGLLKEFRDFAMRGNVVDMAVGVIIGAAFSTVVGSMVKDVLMPPIGYVTGGVDFSDKKLVLKEAVAAAPATKDAAGAVVTPEVVAAPEVAINWGVFVNAVISFIIVAFCLFMIIKAMNTAKAKFEKQQAAAPPPGPTKEQVLLTEIRDLLAQRR